MKPIRKILAIVTVSLLLLSAGLPALAAYSDTSGHWAKSYIDSFTASGYISGYPDGSFKPDNSITRAEFCRILYGFFQFEDQKGPFFPDVSANQWFYPYIEACAMEGCIKGFDDGRAMPDSNIRLQEVAVVLARLLCDGEPPAASDLSSFSIFQDKDSIPAWSRDHVAYLAQNGYFKNIQGAIHVTGDATRAQVVAMLILMKPEPRFAGGSGTSKDPYLVATASHLQNVSKRPGAYFRQTQNIDLSGVVYTPVCTLENPFTGNYDGNGYTISGLTPNGRDLAIFGYNGVDGVVKNITVTGTLTADNQNAGIAAIAVKNFGSIKNSTSRLAVTGRAQALAGIALYNDGTISGCSNAGALDSKVDSSTESGNVLEATGGQCGGIVSENGPNGVITSCTNTAPVSGARVGGIAAVSDGELSDCTNTGSITMHTRHFTSGGIAGISYGEILRCINKGSVASDGQGTSSLLGDLGGIAGLCRGGDLTDCVNEGTVAGLNAGGIVGRAQYATLTNCENRGDLSASQGALLGGIAASAEQWFSPTVLDHCTNSGTLSAVSTQAAGGIAGALTGGSGAYSCSNDGVLNGTDNLGGIAGLSEGGNLYNCLNYGPVTGKTNVGGIVGSLKSAKSDVSTLTACSNFARVSGSLFVGGVAGTAEDTCQISGCEYYAFGVSSGIGNRSYDNPTQVKRIQ